MSTGDHATGAKTTRNAMEGNKTSTIRSMWPRYLNLGTNQVYGPDEGVTGKVSRQRGAKTNGMSIKFARGGGSSNGRKNPQCSRLRLLRSLAELENDADKKFLRNLENDAEVGYESDLGNSPEVFRVKTKHRVYGERRRFYVITKLSYVRRSLY